MEPVIAIAKLFKSYWMGKLEVPVLKGISISVNKGEYVIIKGPSGSGKSTLMNIIGCLDRGASGSYLFEGEDVDKFSDNDLAGMRGEKIGFVFQSFNLIPRLSALKNVELPLLYGNVGAIKRREIAKDTLTRLGLGHRLYHSPAELSGGERQRVAISRAIVASPSIILADEPTGNVDSKSGKEILKIFDNIHYEGGTIMMVTHDENVALRGTRIVTIRDGEIESDKPNNKISE